MIRIICIFLIIFLSTKFINAQSIGIQAGLELYRPHIAPVNRNSRTVNPTIGLNTVLPFAKRSFLRTGVYYSSLKYTDESGYELWTNNYTLTQHNIILPLQWGIKISIQDFDLGIFIGPRLGYSLKFTVYGFENYGSDTLWDFHKEPTYNYKKLYPGLGSGFLLTYKNFNVTIQYSFDVLIPGGSENFLPWANGIISLSTGYSIDLGRK